MMAYRFARKILAIDFFQIKNVAQFVASETVETGVVGIQFGAELGVADAVIRAGSKVNRSQIRASNGDMLHNARMGEMEAQYGELVVAQHSVARFDVMTTVWK